MASVDLDVAAGEFFCLLGPSGCGKTTLLRMVGGYVTPDAGRVVIGGLDATRLPLERRSVGMVFQSYALFPHMSALENAGFGLEARRVPRAERRRLAAAALERVGLPPAAHGRRPAALSGGEQQRVAIARALVIEPALLLLDEPLASLDRRLREATRGELRALQRRTGVATIMVTHDQEDALSLADRVGVMAAGWLLQVDAPEALYARPRTPFVARFLGDANLLPLDGPALSAPLRAALPNAAPGTLALVRPEALLVSRDLATCSARVASIAFLGSDRLLALQLAQGTPVLARLRPSELPELRPDDTVGLDIAPGGAWALPEADPPGLPSAGITWTGDDAD